MISLKNMARAKGHEVVTDATSLKVSVAKALKDEKFLDEVTVKDGKLTAVLTFRSKEPVLMDVKLVSKPGLRIYLGVDELAKIKRPSIFILSTPKGVISSKKALKQGVAGEVIAEIM